MKVKLISATPHGEHTMAYCARVSSPANQDNPDYAKLLRYCFKQGHFSVFEMADMTIEIEASRAISQQILRHRSFNFQEFSQRYAEATTFEYYDARRQDVKNRQNSIDDMSEEDKDWFTDAQTLVMLQASKLYEEAIRRGVAKEQARFLLPLSTTTKLYMKGTVRSFIHYLQVRTDPSTQKEHREIAEAIKAIFQEQFPQTARAVWSNE